MTSTYATQGYTIERVSYTIPSASESSATHTVEMDPATGLLHCDCRAGRYGRDCWHAKAIRTGIAPKPRVRIRPTGPEQGQRRAERLALEAAAARRAYIEAARTASSAEADLWA